MVSASTSNVLVNSVAAPDYQTLLDLITQRRSTYTLSTSSTISDAEIQRILYTVLMQVPSSFGSYTTRMVLVVKEAHAQLWDTITDVVKAVTPADKWEQHTAPRIAGFRNAYGTVLFFEDHSAAEGIAKQFPFIKDILPTFQQHSSAMHQFAVWTALTAAGMGANLQHYSPLIDDRVKAQWNVPSDWSLVAQLVFGTPTAVAGPKAQPKLPITERLFVYGADQEDELEHLGNGLALDRFESVQDVANEEKLEHTLSRFKTADPTSPGESLARVSTSEILVR